MQTVEIVLEQKIANALEQQRQGCLDEARRLCQQVLDEVPEHAAALYLLGAIAAQQGRTEDVIFCYQHIIALKLDNAMAHYNLGVALQSQEKCEEAIVCYRQALSLKPDYANALCNLGLVFQNKGLLDEAVACYQQMLTIQPKDVDGFSNLGLTLHAQGLPDQAILCYQQAIALNVHSDKLQFNFALSLLAVGNYSEGLRRYESRFSVNKNIVSRYFTQAAWNGSDLLGKVIFVQTEQGFGDAIQFVRYISMLKNRGAYVIFEVRYELFFLFKNNQIANEVIAWGEIPSQFDEYCPLLSLARVFDTNLNTVPINIPYLFGDKKLKETWAERLQGVSGMKVGLVWSSGIHADSGGSLRSISLNLFAPIAAIPGVTLISLQKGDGSQQINNVQFPVMHVGGMIQDFADTAAILDNLNLLISVDTSVAHLGGAMHIPTWVLLPFVPDWRWVSGGMDSPWYPDVRLFKQVTRGDWAGVIDQVHTALRSM